ncbi:MAG TPA: DUF2332 domain-containing protein [Candidatus Binatia bacterium]|nr:DUF2332 domain-containing protein [Candidatus Binatia bacterium]
MHEDLSELFERFAKEEFHNSSPLYERLALAVAKDREILSLAAHARKDERVPNLFFAAVHFLLLKGTQHPVSSFYNGTSGNSARAEDPYPQFRSFCLEHGDEIRSLISVRLVQTNEVSRCACLLPAFVLVSRQAHGRPLSLLEIGASAGLNLLWDCYGYNYGEGRQCGELGSPVQIKCVVKGNVEPPIAETLPKVSARVGVDLNPIDVYNSEAVLWLRALVWPEHEKRAQLLLRAVEVAQQQPVKLIPGDAVESLPDLFSMIPEKTTLCIFRIFTQLPPQSRDRLSSLLLEQSAKRDVFLISSRPNRGDASGLWLTSFKDGTRTEKLLAYFENHGEWLEWLNADGV